MHKMDFRFHRNFKKSVENQANASFCGSEHISNAAASVFLDVENVQRFAQKQITKFVGRLPSTTTCAFLQYRTEVETVIASYKL